MRDRNPGDPGPSGPSAHSERDPRPTPSPALRTLRLIAPIGTSGVVLWHVFSLGSIKPRQELAFAVLALAGLGVGLTLLAGLPAATAKLLRHKDLLVPLGLYVTAGGLLDALTAIPALAAVLTPAWPLKILSISLSLSLLLVVQIVLAVVYAGWTTVLVLQAVREDRVDPIGAITDVKRWFLRVLAILFLAWAVLLVGVAVALAVGQASIALALLLIAAASLVWNLATAAVLPVVVAERLPLRAALAQGVRVSWAGKGRWWGAIVLQMLLLGWVTYIYVSYTTSPRPGTVTTHTRSSWHVHGFWTGGYEDTCRWHADLMKAVESAPLPLVATLLGLLFAVLAIVVKLKIVGAIYGPRPGSELGPADPGPAAGLPVHSAEG